MLVLYWLIFVIYQAAFKVPNLREMAIQRANNMIDAFILILSLAMIPLVVRNQFKISFFFLM